MSKHVAIIGAGLTGLNAAHNLDQLGYDVTLFEALPFAGGKLTAGTPNSHQLADALTRMFLSANVARYYSSEIGRDLSFAEVRSRCDAVLVAVGAWHSISLSLPGETFLDGVLPATHFLKQYSLGHAPRLKRRVAIAGGSTLTLRIARLAMQAGAHEVYVFFPGEISQLPVSQQERAEALKEGVLFHPHLQIKGILGTEDVNVRGLRCQCTNENSLDAVHEGKLLSIPGSDCWYDADMLIVAVGETSKTSFLPPQWQDVWGDEGTCITALPGVYIAGDALQGPHVSKYALAASSVRAVQAIHTYLYMTSLCVPSRIS